MSFDGTQASTFPPGIGRRVSNDWILPNAWRLTGFQDDHDRVSRVITAELGRDQVGCWSPNQAATPPRSRNSLSQNDATPSPPTFTFCLHYPHEIRLFIVPANAIL